jgi:hypothetical protein
MRSNRFTIFDAIVATKLTNPQPMLEGNCQCAKALCVASVKTNCGFVKCMPFAALTRFKHSNVSTPFSARTCTIGLIP